MKQKVSTLMDSALYQRVKLQSVVQNKQINEVVGEALELYLRERGAPPGIGGAVAASWGALPLDRDLVQAIVKDEDGLLEA